MLHFGPIDVRTDVFVVIISVLFLAVQLFLCIKIKNLYIRLIPTVLPSVLTVLFMVLTFATEGWDALGFLVLALICACPAAASVLAWIIWVIYKKCKTKKLR